MDAQVCCWAVAGEVAAVVVPAVSSPPPPAPSSSWRHWATNGPVTLGERIDAVSPAQKQSVDLAIRDSSSRRAGY